MSSKSKREFHARKDPRKIAKTVKIHAVRTLDEEQEDVLDQEMLDEIDEFFEDYDNEVDPFDLYGFPLIQEYEE